MSNSCESEAEMTQYLQYPEHLHRKCIICGTQVEYCYPTAGHSYTSFHGDYKDIIRLYTCPNPNCELYETPFNPVKRHVFPYKQFSANIWKWIGEEAKIYDQKPDQIHQRIRKQFHVEISKSTIRNYIHEINAYLTTKIDKKTKELIHGNGKILIAIDGQKPDDKGKALWLFVDLITNRVLKVVILESADAETLHEEIQEIVQTYDVDLIGGVSDKQNSIRAMRENFYEEIPWQYCHFHFYQNLWRPLAKKDSNLHKELKKAIHQLYICSASKSSKVQFEGVGKLPVQTMFKEVRLQLDALLKYSTRKFNQLRGIKSYKLLEQFIAKMFKRLEGTDTNRRVVKIMTRTAEDLQETLQNLHVQYKSCTQLFEEFHAIQEHMSKKAETREKKEAEMDQYFNEIWTLVKGKHEISKKEDLHSLKSTYTTPDSKIRQEWVRLYYSYRSGLFAYYDFPMEAKTNIAMERAFGVEKSRFISRGGKTRVGSQIRIHGPNILKQIYAGKDEVKDHIEKIASNYDRGELQKEFEALHRRTHQETKDWRNQVRNTDGIQAVLQKGGMEISSDKKKD